MEMELQSNCGSIFFTQVNPVSVEIKNPPGTEDYMIIA